MTAAAETDPHADWAPIVVGGPLPMDVATTLMQLIGAAWPSAVIDTSGRHAGQLSRWDSPALVMLIDPKARAKRVTKKQVAEAKQYDDGEGGSLVAITEEDGHTVVKMGDTPEELQLFLGGVAHDLFAQIGGDNYVEWTVRTGDGAHTYVLSIARSKRQTPHALRTKAEKDLEELRAAVRDILAAYPAGCVGLGCGGWDDFAPRLRALVGE
ncbi:MAG TPA: hypothetical protein VGF17_20140 [Phytomonospora sp.]